MNKIAMVIGDLGTPGGAERVAYDLASEFEQRGYELTVITFEEKISLPIFLLPAGTCIFPSRVVKAMHFFSYGFYSGGPGVFGAYSGVNSLITGT